MITEILQAARDRIAAQDALWKDDDASFELEDCTCVGVALYEACWDTYGVPLKEVSQKVYETFLKANNLPVLPDGSFLGIGEWNDRPETTLAEAVAALDAAVNYARTLEGETNVNA